ncbi:MAG: hypothetical protein KGI34_13315 [Bradyrhizobium sp.]|nr:hypothetical protein [Bradyrhizobium sp.]
MLDIAPESTIPGVADRAHEIVGLQLERTELQRERHQRQMQASRLPGARIVPGIHGAIQTECTAITIKAGGRRLASRDRPRQGRRIGSHRTRGRALALLDRRQLQHGCPLSFTEQSYQNMTTVRKFDCVVVPIGKMAIDFAELSDPES